MVAVEHEKFVVIECRGFPLLHAMTLLAIALYLAMEVVFRFSMAAIALQAGIACQQIMVERHLLPGIGAMALIACHGRLHVSVEIIVGPGMAAIAFCPHIQFDERVRKRLATVFGKLRSDMVAMAGNAVLFE